MQAHRALSALLSLPLLSLPLAAQFPVSGWSKISDTQGGLSQPLVNQEYWGGDPVDLGDVDGDGTTDLAVGWSRDDLGGPDRGSILILLRNPDGSVKSDTRIGSGAGGFAGVLDDGDLFGTALASIGDLDGDGVPDVAVGALGDDDGGLNHGAVWLVFLRNNGSVKSHYKISDTTGGFSAPLTSQEWFGTGLRSLGDRNGDGLLELAVGAIGDRDGTGPNNASKGAVFILHLHPIGRVLSWSKISLTSGGFTGPLGDTDHFGSAIEPLGDIDGDGVVDLAVGASATDGGGSARGAVWILRMNANDTVKAETKISDLGGGLQTPLNDGAAFGSGLAAIGDLTGNGRTELAVGAGGLEGAAGGVLLLELRKTGGVTDEWLISPSQGNTPPDVSGSDNFGSNVSLSSNLGGGGPELLASATGDDDGGTNRGAFYTLSLCGLTGAASQTRNGSGVNPALFSELSPAVVGQNWSTEVDLTSIGVAWTAIVYSPNQSLGLPTGFGELLILPPLSTPHVVLFGFHNVPIPFDCGLIGQNLYTQAAIIPADGSGVQLTNAIDIIIGGF